MDLEAAKRRIKQLELELAEYKSSTPGYVLGHPSTMPDRAYQLQLRPLITRGAQLQPNSGVVTKIDNGYSFLSYKDISIKGQQLASAISKCDINIGDCIATFMYNNGRHFLLHYTAACMGVVLNALNFRLFPDDLIYMINHVGDKLIFIDATLLSEFEKINLSKIKQTIKTIIICGANEQSGNWKTKLSNNLYNINVIDFDQFLYSGNKIYKFPDLDERSGLGICFTSGTTGKPKGVIYSHRSSAIHLLVCLMNDFISIKGTDCWLPFAPMFHAQAWLIPYVALCIGYKLVLTNNFSDPNVHMDIIFDQKVTGFYGVPTVMQNIRRAYERNPSKYSRIKGILTRIETGGSSPPSELIDWYREILNVDVIQGWGMTEMNPFGTYGKRISRRMDLNKKDSELLFNQKCAGIPFPTVEIKCVNPNNFDEELPWDGKSIGEIITRGTSVVNSYFNVDKNIMKNKFYKGWLITGDLGYRTESGQLIISDRSKDMIKSGGEWISSVDMEGHIMGLNGIDLAAVVGVKHEKWMQRPVVIIILKNKKNKNKFTLNKIREHCKSKFAKYALPDDVLFWDEMPLTTTGKMNKKVIREKLKQIGYVHPDERNIKSKL